MDTDDFFSQIVKKIKIRMKYISDNFSDEELKEYTQEVHQKVLNYLNRERLPEELNYILVNMCVDYLRFLNAQQEYENPDADIDINVGDISSVSIGDTSVAIGSSKTTLANKDAYAHTSNLDDILFNYRSQLNMFRRMRW